MAVMGAEPVDLVQTINDSLTTHSFIKSRPGPPMTLCNAASAKVRLIVWCKACGHQVEPDPAEIAARYGAGTSVLEWRQRLLCSRCGGRQIDLVVTGTERRQPNVQLDA